MLSLNKLCGFILVYVQEGELPRSPQEGVVHHLPLQLGMLHPHPRRYHIVSPLVVY